MSTGFILLLILIFLSASCIIAPLPVLAGSRTIAVPDDYPTASPSPSPSPTATPLNTEATNFSQAMLIAAVVTASVFGAGFLIYFKKRNR